MVGTSPRFRLINSSTPPVMHEIVATAEKLEALINTIPAGRYRSLAYTALEEAVLWAEKAAKSSEGDV